MVRLFAALPVHCGSPGGAGRLRSYLGSDSERPLVPQLLLVAQAGPGRQDGSTDQPWLERHTGCVDASEGNPGWVAALLLRGRRDSRRANALALASRALR
jgi:hypothetical protein